MVDKHPILATIILFISLLMFLNCTSHVAQHFTKKQLTKEQYLKQAKFQLLCKEIINLESGGRHDGVWGDDGKSYGECQWQEHSFNYYKRLYGMLKAEWKNRYDQTQLMVRCLRDGYGYEWTTYKTAYVKVYGHNPPPKGIKLIDV
jgi:hypothetical protein